MIGQTDPNCPGTERDTDKKAPIGNGEDLEDTIAGTIRHTTFAEYPVLQYQEPVQLYMDNGY